MARKRKKGPTSAKAKKMLSHGTVHGKKLTARQKRFLRAKAAGK